MFKRCIPLLLMLCIFVSFSQKVKAATLLSDSFTGTTIDTAKWTENDSAGGGSGGSAGNVRQNGVLTIIGNSTWSGNSLVSSSNYSRSSGDVVIEADITQPDCTAAQSAAIGYGDPTLAGNVYILVNYTGSLKLFSFGDNVTSVETGFSCTNNVQYHVKLVVFQTGGASVYINGSSTASANIPSGTFTDKKIFIESLNSGTTVTYDDLLVTSTPTPITLTVAAPTFVSTGTSTISVTSSGASGGSSPYTYQWKRSTVSGSGYTNVAGGTALTLADTGVAAATGYYYVLTSTDSGAGIGTSTEIYVKTQPSTTSTAVIVSIGDSIIDGFANQGGGSPLTRMETSLEGRGHITDVTVREHGQVGSVTADWNVGGSHLNAVIADVKTYGANMATILLGTNDAKTSNHISTTTYRTNISNIATALRNAGVQYVFISYQPYIDYVTFSSAWELASLTDLSGYRSVIDALDNGTSTRKIGDNPSIYTTTANATSTYQNDGVHLTTAGINLLGDEWATDIDALLYGLTPTPSTITQGTIGNSISLVGLNSSWTAGTPGSPTFSLTGGTGASITAQTITSPTTATLTVTAGSATGLLVVTDSTRNATTSITVSADTVAPVVSSTASGSLSTSGVTITWTTDKSASTLVNYGTTASYGSASTLDSTLATSHSVTLSGLSAGTEYHYQAVSTDVYGNIGYSGDLTFITTAAAGGSSSSSSSGSRRVMPAASVVTTTTTTTQAPGVPGTSTSLITAGLVPTQGGLGIHAGLGEGAAPLVRTLAQGTRGEDVRTLQRYLNANGFIIATSGPGSLGNETNYYGPLTKAAVIRLQKANGIVPSIGFFGPITKKFVTGI